MDDFLYHQFTLPSKVRLLNTVNMVNTTTLTDEDVIFSPPVWHHDEDKGTNTRVLIQSRGGAVIGEAEFHYTRYDLGEVFSSVTPIVYVTPDKTHARHILESLAQKYRVHLTPEDIVDEPLPVDAGGQVPFALKVSGRSLGWFGYLTVQLIHATTTLDTRITHQFGSIANYTPDGDKTRAELWYGSRRVIRQIDVVSWLEEPVTAGAPLTASMVEQVALYFDEHWSIVPGVDEPYNLYGSTIAYFGPNDAAIGLPGTRDDVAVLIRLGAHCSNFSGYLAMTLPEHMVRAYYDAQD